MRVLALDTTTPAGSVALVCDRRDDGDRGESGSANEIVEQRHGDLSRTHAERLPADIFDLLDRQGLGISDIDLFAVAAGPGSFTGLRIGIATIQGLALVRRRPVVSVSALAALAHAGSDGLAPSTRVAAWMDAHRHDVFAALFEVSSGPMFTADRLREVEGATVGEPSATLARWRNEGVSPALVIGDGAALYADIVMRFPDPARVVAAPPLAGAIGLVALECARRGETISPAAIHPVYVRRPDAELAREHALAHRRVDVARPD